MSRWCDAVNKLKFSVQATVGSDVRILISLVSRSILVELSDLSLSCGLLHVFKRKQFLSKGRYALKCSNNSSGHFIGKIIFF